MIEDLESCLHAIIPQPTGWPIKKRTKYWANVLIIVDFFLKENGLTNEEKINRLEYYLTKLIYKIPVSEAAASENRLDRKLKFCVESANDEEINKRLKLMALLVILHRGCYVDDFYSMIKTLLLLPLKKTGNRPDSPIWMSLVDQSFLVSFNCRLLSYVNNSFNGRNPRFYESLSLSDKISHLKRMIRELSETATGNEKAYYELCLHATSLTRLLPSSIVQSVFATAAMEAMDTYLIPLCVEAELISVYDQHGKMNPLCIDSNFVSPFDPPKLADRNARKVEAIIVKNAMRDIQIHLTRIRLLCDQSVLNGEPLGHYVKYKLSRLLASCPDLKNEYIHAGLELGDLKADKLNSTLLDLQCASALSRQEKVISNINLFNEVFQDIVYKLDDVLVERINQCIKELQANDCPMGEFLAGVLFCLRTPRNEETCATTIAYLKKIVVSDLWLEHVGELWIHLANYFYVNCSRSFAFYQELAIICIDEVSNRYPARVFDKAQEIALIIKRADHISKTPIRTSLLSSYPVCEQVKSENPYVKQHQYAMVGFLLQAERPFESVEGLSNQLTRLMSGNYPYVIPILISYLCLDKSTVEYKAAYIAVSAIYGEKYGRRQPDGSHSVNPLKLCHVLSQAMDNRQFIILAQLIKNAQANGVMQEEIESWQGIGFGPPDLNYKLYGLARSKLFGEVHRADKLIPGGHKYLSVLDIKICKVADELIAYIEGRLRENPDEKFWCFTKNRPGLLLVCFAMLSVRDRNSLLWKALSNYSRSIVLPLTLESPRKRSDSAVVPDRSPKNSRLSSEPVTPPRTRSSTMNSLNNSGGTVRVSGVIQIPRGSQDVSRSPVPRLTTSAGRKVSSLGDSSGRIFANRLAGVASTGSDSSQRYSHGDDSAVNGPRAIAAENPEIPTVVPSFLCYYVQAWDIWVEKLLGNSNRDPSDIKKFKECLENALPSDQYQDPRERDYIKALIYYKYFETKNKDPIWLSKNDELLISISSQKFTIFKQKERAKQNSASGEDELYNCFLVYEIRVLLESAMQGTMFPPAVLFYTEDLAVHELNYLMYDKAEVRAYLNSMIKFCKIAVEQYGYLVPLYALAQKINKYIDDLADHGSRLELLELAEKYFRYGEQYSYIESSQRKDIVANIERERARIEREQRLFGSFLRHVKNDVDLVVMRRVSRSFKAVCDRVLSEREIGYQNELPVFRFNENPCENLPINFQFGGESFRLEIQLTGEKPSGFRIVREDKDGFFEKPESIATDSIERHELFFLNGEASLEMRKIFAKAIPEGHCLGKAKSKADNFFDSCSLALNEMLNCQQFTIKSLRLLCHDYVVALDQRCKGDPNHSDNWIGQHFKNPADYQHYLANILFTVEEREQGEGVGQDKLAVWGGQQIDGRIICEKLDVKLHIIEIKNSFDDLMLTNQKFALCHTLIDNGGLRIVDPDSSAWSDKSMIHLGVSNQHVVPILKKAVSRSTLRIPQLFQRRRQSTSDMSRGLSALKEYFDQSARLYKYSNKRCFTEPPCHLIAQQNCLLIKHLDVAILGLIKIATLSGLNALPGFLMISNESFGQYFLWDGTKDKIASYIKGLESHRDGRERALTKDLSQGSRNGSRGGSRKGPAPAAKTESPVKSPLRSPRLRMVDPSSISSPFTSPPASRRVSPELDRKAKYHSAEDENPLLDAGAVKDALEDRDSQNSL